VEIFWQKTWVRKWSSGENEAWQTQQPKNKNTEYDI
jgi:hypothetical protein